MTRLFLPTEKLASEQIIITGDEARYLSLVLRMKPGEQIIIFDGTGYRYICSVVYCHKKEVVIEKIKKEPYSAESPVSITLAQGIPKGDKMDFIIQKSTEMGVKKILPLITERSQVKHTSRSERWRKIALSASQQSGREKIPDIEEPVSFKEFLNKTLSLEPRRKDNENVIARSPDSIRDNEAILKNEILLPISRHQNDNLKQNCRGIIFSEEEKNQNLKKVLKDFAGSTTITLLIGPEGGFTDTETKMAVEKGFIAVSLGPRILRTETAALSAISIIQYELGDMG